MRSRLHAARGSIWEMTHLGDRNARTKRLRGLGTPACASTSSTHAGGTFSKALLWSANNTVRPAGPAPPAGGFSRADTKSPNSARAN